MPLTWVTLDVARSIWGDAASIADDTLTLILATAEAQCRAFAPVLAAGVEVPANYVLATVTQGKSIYRALSGGGTQEIGPDGLIISVPPLDWHVQNMLRPRNPRPVIA